MQSAAYYDQHAERFIADTLALDMTALYAPFLARVPAGGRVLDLGCGSGRDSQAFLARGYDVVATDPSAVMAEHTERLIGRPVLRLTVQALDVDQEFDGIWACASLLHVPRAEMGEALDRVGRALRVGGALLASFKYGAGEVVRDGRLFNSYDEGAFQALVAGHPLLAIASLWTTQDARPSRAGERWLNVLATRSR